MNSIEQRCDMLNLEIDELKAEILGEFVCNDEEDKLDQLINLALMLGEAYMRRDYHVSKLVTSEEVVEAFKEN